jgi:hypothetical protein
MGDGEEVLDIDNLKAFLRDKEGGAEKNKNKKTRQTRKRKRTPNDDDVQSQPTMKEEEKKSFTNVQVVDIQNTRNNHLNLPWGTEIDVYDKHTKLTHRCKIMTSATRFPVKGRALFCAYNIVTYKDENIASSVTRSAAYVTCDDSDDSDSRSSVTRSAAFDSHKKGFRFLACDEKDREEISISHSQAWNPHFNPARFKGRDKWDVVSQLKNECIVCVQENSLVIPTGRTQPIILPEVYEIYQKKKAAEAEEKRKNEAKEAEKTNGFLTKYSRFTKEYSGPEISELTNKAVDSKLQIEPNAKRVKIAPPVNPTQSRSSSSSSSTPTTPPTPSAQPPLGSSQPQPAVSDAEGIFKLSSDLAEQMFKFSPHIMSSPMFENRKTIMLKLQQRFSLSEKKDVDVAWKELSADGPMLAVAGFFLLGLITGSNYHPNTTSQFVKKHSKE